MGKLWIPTSEVSEFFNVVHVGNRDGKWFSVYPLGWPLVMALGLSWDIVDYLNPFFSSLSILFFFLAGRRILDEAGSLLGLMLVAFSPFYTFTSGTYSSHSLCILLIAIFLYAFIRWVEAKDSREEIIFACIVGFCVGYGLMTRYLTMGAFTFPFLLWKYLPVFKRQRAPSRSEWLVFGIIIFFMASIFVHNFLVTGKPWKAPNKYDKSWEKLGFSDDYSPWDGVLNIVARVFYMTDWLAPSFFLYFMVITLRKVKKSALEMIVHYGFYTLVFAYFLYFSWGGNQFGPRYYYEGILLLGMVAGSSLSKEFRSSETSGKRSFIFILVLLTIGSNIYIYAKQIPHVEEYTAQRKALYVKAGAEVTKPAIVFIQGHLGSKLILGHDDAIRNAPHLKGAILYAHDLGKRNEALMKHYPDRTYYRGYYDKKTLKPVIEEIS